MSPSRRGISSLTLAVGLGVAVTTSQGVAQAETGDPPTPKNDTSTSTTENATTQPPDADGASDPQTTGVTGKRKLPPIFESIRLTIRHHGDTESTRDPDGVLGNVRTTARAPRSNGPADPLPNALSRRSMTTDRPRIAAADVPDERTVAVEPSRSPLLRPAAMTKVVERSLTSARPMSLAAPTTAVANATVTNAIALASPTPTRVFGGLLSALGFNPSTVNPRQPTLPLPRLIEMAFVAVRRTFFNQTPRATTDVNVNTVDGTASGKINGMDRDGDKLTYRPGTPPTHGTVDLEADGSFTYTPDKEWAAAGGGPQEFTVIVSDASSAPHLHLFSGGHSTTATVKFTVPQTNRAPTVEVGPPVDLGAGRLRYAVATSDEDAGDTVTLVATAVDGKVERQVTGTDVTYTFTPDPTYAHGLTTGGATEVGRGSVTFVATDSRGASSEATRAIAINGVNQAPVVAVGPPRGNTVSISVTDPDGDAVTNVDPVVSHGTLTGGATGTPGRYQYAFTVDPKYAHELSEGGATQPGTASVQFTATDGHGGSTPVAASITVDANNQNPVITVDNVRGNTATVTVKDSDGDPVDLTATASNGTYEGQKTGTDIDGNDVYTYTFTPDAKYAHDLTGGGSNQTGMGAIEFTATDRHGGTSQSAAANFVVVGVNHAPVITVSPPQGNVVTVTISDPDGDDVDLHPTSTNGTFAGVKTGTDVSGRDVYAYTFTPNAAYAHGLTAGGSTQTGSGGIRFAPTDGHGGTAEPVTATFAVAGVNHAPVVTTAAAQGNSVKITITDPDGDSVEVSPPVTTNGSLVGGATGTPGVYEYTFTADPAYAHQLTAGGSTRTGLATVQFTADDTHGAQTPSNVELTVIGANQAPSVNTVGSTRMSTQSRVVTFTLVPSDADNDTAKILSVTAPTNPGTLRALENADGTWTVTYTADYNDVHGLGPSATRDLPLTVTMSDDHSVAPTTSTVNVTLVGLNRPPEATTADPVLTRTTGAVNGAITWTDRDTADTLSGYSATLSDPSKGSLQYDSATGKYTFTPNDAARAAATVAGAPLTDRRALITFTVSDGYGPVTKTVPVVIAPRDNAFVGFYDSDGTQVRADDPNAVVVTPDGKHILVGNSSSGRLTLIDAQTGEIVNEYGVGDFTGVDSTKQMIYTPAGATHPAAYVLATDNKLYQIDTNDLQSEPKTVQLPGVVQQVATNEDGSTVYVTVTRTIGSNSITQLYAVDAATMTVGATPVLTQQVPTGPMALDPASGKLVIAIDDLTSGGYIIVDPAGGTTTVRPKPQDVHVDDFALSRSGEMWVVKPGDAIADPSVVHIVTSTGGIEDATDVDGAKKIVLAPDGGRAYVLTNNSVVVLDTGKGVNNRVVATIRLDRQNGDLTDIGTATDLAISPDGTHLYVTRKVRAANGQPIDRVSVFSIAPSEAPPDPSVV